MNFFRFRFIRLFLIPISILAIFICSKYIIKNFCLTPRNPKNSIINSSSLSFKYKNLENSKCNPFKPELSKQYYTHFNGHRYPRHLPLFLNKSIDFHCLNRRSSSLKRILAWNQFFGDFSYGKTLYRGLMVSFNVSKVSKSIYYAKRSWFR